MKKLITLILLSLVFTSTAQAVPTRWSTYDAGQRLEIGRWASANGVRNATCVGIGKSKTIDYEKKFLSFECRVTDKDYENERQLVLTPTGETTFKVKWLTLKPACTG